MAPVLADLDSVSDEDYLVLRAKAALKSDPFAAKAWMITAKTLFPDNFGVQFEAYQIVKAAKHLKEAAKCFVILFLEFYHDPALWQEVQALTNALRADNGQPEYAFLQAMFSHLPSDIQAQVLLATADRTTDPMEHSRLLLLLLNRFPTCVRKHGPRLVETLISAEHKQNFQSPLNCYRKVLVCEVLPLLGGNQAELPHRLALRLIRKAVEFYMCCIISPSSTVQELGETDGQIEDPWGSVFMCVHWLGRCLEWELAAAFSQPWNREALCQQVVQYATTHPCTDTDTDSNQSNQLIYCTTLLLLRCLHEYTTALSPGDQQLVLVEIPVSRPVYNKEPSAKRRKTEDEGPLLTIGGVASSSGRESISQYFLAALRCWDLIHSGENLRRGVLQFITSLSLESWLLALSQDVAVYKEEGGSDVLNFQYDDEVSLRSPSPALPVMISNLRLASAYYSLAAFRDRDPFVLLNLQSTVVRALAVVKSLSKLPNAGSLTPNLVQATKGRHLHFLPLTRSSVLQYSIQLVLSALQQIRQLEYRPGVNEQTCELALGHMIVLLQLELSIGGGRGLFETILEEVRTCSTFSYHLFTSYIINVDVLEEFMYMSRVGPVTLDILPPSSAHHASQRRMSTRGADKGVKEDIKTAMRRQMARSGEPLEALLTDFLTNERNSILQSVGREEEV